MAHWQGIALSGLALLAGCRHHVELGQVSGTVRAAGQPISNAVVTFVPERTGEVKLPLSQAQTDAQGNYQLRTSQQEPGAVIGKHRVTVEDLAILAAPRSSDGTVLRRPAQRFAPGYSDPLRTPLLFEVKPGTQQIDLLLSP